MMKPHRIRTRNTILLFVVVLGIVRCGRLEPILIGFSGQLTGSYSNIGIQGRNGVQLAIDKINETGGIAGRLGFSSSGKPDLSDIVAEVKATSPDAVAIIASARDSALIAQNIRLMKWDPALFCAGWAQNRRAASGWGQSRGGN